MAENLDIICQTCFKGKKSDSAKFFVRCHICLLYNHANCDGLYITETTFKDKITRWTCASCTLFARELMKIGFNDYLSKHGKSQDELIKPLIEKQERQMEKFEEIMSNISEEKERLNDLKSSISEKVGEMSEMLVNLQTKGSIVENQNKILEELKKVNEEVIQANKASSEITWRPGIGNNQTGEGGSRQSYADKVKRIPESRVNSINISLNENQVDSTQIDKQEVLSTLDNIQIAHTKIGRNGNLLLTFKNEVDRDEALARLSDKEKLNVNTTTKFNPRIRISWINELENLDVSNDGKIIVDTIINRNYYLENVPNIHSKLKYKAIVKQNGVPAHIIMECSPDVRKIIHNKGNRLFMAWRSYEIVDSFFVPRCFHCQSLGHLSRNCNEKQTNKAQVCRDCGVSRDENHTCGIKCCINCKKAGKQNTNHSASDKDCPTLFEKIKFIQSRTDDGSE